MLAQSCSVGQIGKLGRGPLHPLKKQLSLQEVTMVQRLVPDEGGKGQDSSAPCSVCPCLCPREWVQPLPLWLLLWRLKCWAIPHGPSHAPRASGKSRERNQAEKIQPHICPHTNGREHCSGCMRSVGDWAFQHSSFPCASHAPRAGGGCCWDTGADTGHLMLEEASAYGLLQGPWYPGWESVLQTYYL